MISLALDFTLPGYKDRTYVRRDSTPQAIVELTEAFVNELHRIKEEMQQLLPAYLKDSSRNEAGNHFEIIKIRA